jgi:hypothetical protein
MPIIIKTPDDRISLLIGRLILEREALIAKLEEIQEQLKKQDEPKNN